MSTSQHTPGPWHLCGTMTGNVEFHAVETESGTRVGVVRTGPDAKLIAAAPELLSICRRLLIDPDMDDATATQLLTAAIAKAEGSLAA